MSLKILTIIFLLYSSLFVNSELKAQNIVSDSSLFKNIDTYFTVLTKMDKFSGSVLISRKGKVILRKGYAMANYENDIPNIPKTAHRICSVSKQFTAVAVLQLEEKGLLKVEDFIGEYIPSFQKGDKITIHHLLSNTSGISDGVALDKLCQTLSTDELIKYTQPITDTLLFEPGEGYYYSNLGYNILSIIIEKVSGITFEEYMSENIFEPLGMNQTTLFDNQMVLKNKSYGYRHKNNELVTADDYCYNCRGAGGLYSTVDDLNIWTEQLAAGKVIRAETRAKMLTPYSENGYGYGIHIYKLFNHTIYEHSGSANGFKTHLLRLPDDKITIVYLSNYGDIPLLAVNKDIVAIALGEKYTIPGTVSRKLAKIDSLVCKEYEGEYQFVLEEDNILEVVAEGSRMFLIDKTIDEKQEIFPENDSIFFMDPMNIDSIEFVRDEQNRVTHLIFGAFGGGKYIANKIR